MDQQKLINKYLMKQLGEKEGIRLYHEQKKCLDELVKRSSGKTKNQMKTLKGTILPRVALYLTLLEDKRYQGKALELTETYMYSVIGKQKHDSMVRMEKIPGFYQLYSSIFIKIMEKTDLQKSIAQKKKNKFCVTITECLWHNACVENGCPELCACFCEVDHITYGKLHKIGFTRTQTLGTGGAKCDFTFYKK